MMHILVHTLFLVFPIPMSAQWSSKIKGNGNVVTENRDVAVYDEVDVNGNINVVLVDGNEKNWLQ